MNNRIEVKHSNEYHHITIRFREGGKHEAHMFLHESWGPDKVAHALWRLAKSTREIPQAGLKKPRPKRKPKKKAGPVKKAKKKISKPGKGK